MDTTPGATTPSCTQGKVSIVETIPQELWRIIFRCLPRPGRWSWDKAHRDLVSCSTVCKNWQHEAESILYRSVRFTKETQLGRFCNSLESRPPRAVATQELLLAPNMALWGTDLTARARFRATLPALVNLKHLLLHWEYVRDFLDHPELRILSVNFPQQGQFDQALVRRFFASYPSIEAMFFTGRIVDCSEGHGILPRLRTLYMPFDGTSAFVNALPHHITDLTIPNATPEHIATALALFGSTLRSFTVSRCNTPATEADPNPAGLPFWPTAMFSSGLTAPELRYLRSDDDYDNFTPGTVDENVPMTFPGIKYACPSIHTFVWRPSFMHKALRTRYLELLSTPCDSETPSRTRGEAYSAALLDAWPTLQRIFLPHAMRQDADGVTRMEYAVYTRKGSFHTWEPDSVDLEWKHSTEGLESQTRWLD